MHHPHAQRRAAASVVAGVSLAALAVGALLLAAVAHAALIDVPPTGQPGRLVLSSDPYPVEFLDLSPGDPRFWEVGARLENADEATLALNLRTSGELVAHPRGLTMTVDACAVAWSGRDATPQCASGAQRIAVATPADSSSSASPTFALRPLTAGAPVHLLITLAVEDSAAARADETLRGLTGDMAVGLTATAFDGHPVPPAAPALPPTGFDPSGLGAAGLLAAGLLGLGVALRMARTGASR